MSVIDDALSWLNSLDSVHKAVLMEGDVRTAVFDEEASVGTMSGIAMDNEALREARGRKFNVVIVTSGVGRLPFEKGFDSIMMKDGADRVCGFQVNTEEDRARVDADGRYVWLSDDFALDASVDFSDVRFVLPPVPFHPIERDTGVKDAILMFPAPSTVQLALDKLSPESPDGTPVFVLSFDA